jgi:TPR repeat protein
MARARTAVIAIAVLIGVTGADAAGPRTGAGLQDELDAAVLRYESADWPAAAAAFERLARARVPAAMHNLGVMHFRGQLPNARASEGLRWLRQAAELGFVTSMVTLGQAYENGDAGRRDLAEAYRWQRQAAEAGSVDGQLAVATAHYLGRGARKDVAAAARWYREAAKGGDVGAQYLIASMYETGDGVERDLRLARYWYGVAAKNGDEAAPGKLKEIETRLLQQPG